MFACSVSFECVDSPCPLCSETRLAGFARDKKRHYQQCHHCGFVFVPRAYHLDAAKERAEYDLHQNSAQDAGYLRFLERAIAPLSDRLSPSMQGLDFGCGPQPVLAAELQRRFGVSMAVFDPFYANEPELLGRVYDFIVATEVVEHLSQPLETLSALWQCLDRQGVMVLMTKRLHSRQAFERWHYKNDPTHIGFFSRRSFTFLASRLGARIHFCAADVVLLERF